MSRTLAYLFAMSWGAAGALVLFAALRPAGRRKLTAKGLRSPLGREAVLALFWMFCGGMAAITLTPRWVIWSLVDLVNHGIWNAGGYPFFELGTVNWIPLQTFAADRYSLYILAGNIIMFLPFGFFAALLWRRVSVKDVVIIGLIISGGIESWQLIIGRTWDIDDLLLNTLGTCVGFLIWKLLDRRLPGKMRQLRCIDTESENVR